MKTKFHLLIKWNGDYELGMNLAGNFEATRGDEGLPPWNSFPGKRSLRGLTDE